MPRVRRIAVWLLCLTLAVPGNLMAAAASKPLSSLDAIARAAGSRLASVFGDAATYAASGLGDAAAYAASGLGDAAAYATAGSAMAGDGVDGGTCPNPIACENALPGVGPEVWDLPGKDAGDLSIQGFATEISVNPGETVSFKIDTDAAGFRIDIYRLDTRATSRSCRPPARGRARSATSSRARATSTRAPGWSRPARRSSSSRSSGGSRTGSATRPRRRARSSPAARPRT